MTTRRTLLTGAALALATPALIRPARADLPVPPLGEDGLHKPDWLVETFRDMRDDLAEARDAGKRMLVLVEQRGCIYCTRMHEHVYTDERIAQMLRDDFFVVQMNLFGNIPVTDFDGEELDERDMMVRWGVVFTPTMLFMPDTIPEQGTAAQNAVMVMPGAFERGTTRLMLQWVLEKGYEGDEHFQHYVARNLDRG
ncbi:thioredoxin family protein [Rhodobacter sp. NTK016B]|uniref:thioredoxin family protein n=1 Tax=Rhodobacter sp. NTK016B TaxID=2759676 RepID=UPI001A8E0533|nr:thioredoxin family protein [Rhodobacter sp. NTK016B]MBN8293927.1 thioredoxin family protein [Rhodobacter sp. NTK016B]